jgi:hypothetical protein
MFEYILCRGYTAEFRSEAMFVRMITLACGFYDEDSVRLLYNEWSQLNTVDPTLVLRPWIAQYDRISVDVLKPLCDAWVDFRQDPLCPYTPATAERLQECINWMSENQRQQADAAAVIGATAGDFYEPAIGWIASILQQTPTSEKRARRVRTSEPEPESDLYNT